MHESVYWLVFTVRILSLDKSYKIVRTRKIIFLLAQTANTCHCFLITSEGQVTSKQSISGNKVSIYINKHIQLRQRSIGTYIYLIMYSL